MQCETYDIHKSVMYDNSPNVERGKVEIYYTKYTIVKLSNNKAAIALKGRL